MSNRIQRGLLRRVATRQLRRSLGRGDITLAQHTKATEALKNDEFVGWILEDSEALRAGDPEESTGRPIIDWIVENWPAILAMIMKLLPLLLII